MPELEGIKAKIRALRARTVENGCTEAEALAAAGKVMELLARHGLAAGDEEIAEQDVALGLRAHPGLDVLWPSIAWVCHCELLHITGLDRPWLRYVGRDPWPEAAAYLHEVVSAAAHRAMVDFRGTASYRRHYRPAAKLVAEHHFQAGFAAGLVGKLRSLKQARNEAAEQRQDLVAAGQAVSRMATTTHQARGVRGGEGFRDARGRGQAAGQAAHVGWGVGQAGPAGLLGERSSG